MIIHNPRSTFDTRPRPERHAHRRPTPVRAYIEKLLPAVLDGTVNPGRVFDRTLTLEGSPDGYRAMDQREAPKVLLTP